MKTCKCKSQIPGHLLIKKGKKFMGFSLLREGKPKIFAIPL